jgi:hypothetical protein
LAARFWAGVLNPSNKVMDAERPAERLDEPPVTVVWVRSSHRLDELRLQDDDPLIDGSQFPMASRLLALATATCPRACTICGLARSAMSTASPSVTVGT